MRRYKFLRQPKKNMEIRSQHGDFVWEIGKWYHHEAELDMCNAGFHCSKEIQQAFSYIQGEVLAVVEVKGNKEIQDDKEVYEHMKIVKAYRWTKKDSVALSIYAAELVIDNFEKEFPNDKRPREAIEAAKKVLEKDTKKNRDAAWSAAESAARSAWSAESAAESAWSAESAARSAARSAAWSAARSAARAAAWSAGAEITKKIEKWMKNRINELEEI